MSYSWSNRIYQSLSNRQSPGSQHVSGGQPPPAPPPSFGFPRLRSSEQRRQRQLLLRLLDAGLSAYSFEAPPGPRLKPRLQSVLIAWPCSRAGLNPGGARIALMANFVLLINRAFGHRVGHTVASVLPDSFNADYGGFDAEVEKRNSLLFADIERLGLRRCRLEAEDCYARESHRLAKTLSSLRLAGSDTWCNRRLGDLLAALARAERSACHRLHWVASGAEAHRFADLAVGLRNLGYGQLANPSPWPMHVSVGPVVIATGTPNRLEDLLSSPWQQYCSESRDNLVLQMLAQSRELSVELNTKEEAGSIHCGLTASRLHRVREALMQFESVATDEAAAADYRGSWTPREAALAKHLAEFPEAAKAAYLSYEPQHLVAYLSGLVQLIEAGESANSCWSVSGDRDGRLLAAAAGRVLTSACALLGL